MVKAKLALAAAIAGFSVLGFAQASDDPTLTSCRAIENGAERLACYDALADAFAPSAAPAPVAAVAAPAETVVAAAPSAPIAAPKMAAKASREAKMKEIEDSRIDSEIIKKATANAEPEDVAAMIRAVRRAGEWTVIDVAALHSSVSVLKKSKKGAATKIEVHVIAIDELANGKYRFLTADGQAWTQVETIEVRTPRKFPEEGMSAEIRMAALGSYFFKLDGYRAIRVRPRR